ncbi:PNS1 protein [Phytophthora nicotianae]|uniref:Choline transporter-like protein n=1 Tax=Phytophthora nicotianae TaxID=4792 RepID=A0A0W8C422_PHYNI|nr:PNS1 protein [Phytophthora nicotianae]
MEYFNRWAYVYVGVYGYSFMSAGKAVSQLFHQRGFTALINDDLVHIVIRLTAIGVALLAILGFIIGFSVALTPLAVISSSVATIFVCFAEDPAPFQRSHPELYAALAQGWHSLHPEFIAQAGYWHA